MATTAPVPTPADTILNCFALTSDHSIRCLVSRPIQPGRPVEQCWKGRQRPLRLWVAGRVGGETSVGEEAAIRRLSPRWAAAPGP
jgi:hypothetical protein